ncbi:MAG: alpha/beta hydrolase [Mycobacterium sp.]|nr:alpha/beta hydrolase [Mycobacterium sp.]
MVKLAASALSGSPTQPKPALVLLHGMTSSGRAWQELVPALSQVHEVHTPTALGHRGGTPVSRPTTLTDVVDAAERQLDEAGLDRPHLTGHSLGGYVAIELARRGRAATVLALSPAGFWSPGDGTATLVMHGLRRSTRIARMVRPLIKAAVGTARGRQAWMGSALRRPDSMTPAQARNVIDDQVRCTLAEWLFIDDDHQLAPLDPLPCPITVAWAEHDEVLPLESYAEAVHARLPGATFMVLPGVGHAAMVDDRALVEQTILRTSRS